MIRSRRDPSGSGGGGKRLHMLERVDALAHVHPAGDAAALGPHLGERVHLRLRTDDAGKFLSGDCFG